MNTKWFWSYSIARRRVEGRTEEQTGAILFDFRRHNQAWQASSSPRVCGEEHSRRATLSSSNHVEPLGARVHSHPGVQLQERRLPCKLRLTTGKTTTQHFACKPAEKLKHQGGPTWRSIHYIHTETRTSSHTANHLGVTWTLRRQLLGLWRLSRKPQRNPPSVHNPTGGHRVQRGGPSCRVQSRRRRQQLLNVHTERNESSSTVTLLTGSTSRNSFREMWVCGESHLLGKAVGCSTCWVCRVRIKEEKLISRRE